MSFHAERSAPLSSQWEMPTKASTLTLVSQRIYTPTEESSEWPMCLAVPSIAFLVSWDSATSTGMTSYLSCAVFTGAMLCVYRMLRD